MGNLIITNTQNVTLELPAIPDNSVLTSVTQQILIQNNQLLTSLGTQLNTVESVGSPIFLRNNPLLTDIDTFDALTLVTDITVRQPLRPATPHRRGPGTDAGARARADGE